MDDLQLKDYENRQKQLQDARDNRSLKPKKEVAPVDHVSSPGPKLQNLPRNRKYLDYYPAKKCDAKIIFCMTKKDTGKTTQIIREMLIEWMQNKKPSGYVRLTKEQKDLFASEFEKILVTLNFNLTNQFQITSKGLFYKKFKTDEVGQELKKEIKYKNRTRKGSFKWYPVIYFFSVNEAMKIQSTSYEQFNLLVFDEIQDHFRESSILNFNKTINLINTVLRDRDLKKIYFISNAVNANDIFFIRFGIDKKVSKIKMGTINKFQITTRDGNYKIGVWRPKDTKQGAIGKASAISVKLSHSSDYGAVINSDYFYFDTKDLIYIKTHGNFKCNININGFKVGYWISDKGYMQFSSKMNPTGKTIYFSYLDYTSAGAIGDLDWVKQFKHKLIANAVQFENYEIFKKMIELVKLKMV